jgi:hypothetical protein
MYSIRWYLCPYPFTPCIFCLLDRMSYSKFYIYEKTKVFSKKMT